MIKRAHISLKTKLAACVRELFQLPYEDCKLMSEDQVLSLATFDHGILHGIEPVDEHWNLTPRMIVPHREKSKRDTSIVAKAVRIDDKWREFTAAMAVGTKPLKRQSRWAKRKFR